MPYQVKFYSGGCMGVNPSYKFVGSDVVDLVNAFEFS